MAFKGFLKGLLQSIIILLIAGMIVGGFYLLVTRSRAFPVAQGNNLTRFDQRTRLNTRGEDPAGSLLLGRPEREFGDRDFERRPDRFGSLIAWLDIARNLGIIALITCLVVGLQWALKWLRKRRPARG